MRARNPIVIHYVFDMERARRFYLEVFEVKPSFESPGWTTLDFGAIELALHILARKSHRDRGFRGNSQPPWRRSGAKVVAVATT